MKVDSTVMSAFFTDYFHIPETVFLPLTLLAIIISGIANIVVVYWDRAYAEEVVYFLFASRYFIIFLSFSDNSSDGSNEFTAAQTYFSGLMTIQSFEILIMGAFLEDVMDIFSLLTHTSSCENTVLILIMFKISFV